MVVYLVGAGPGDPELITIKAQRLISDADAIVYDRLANSCLLEYTKPGCKKFFAGKKANNHYMKQHEINDLLVKLGGKFEVVVRLKGGDPFLFGRGGEEMEVLAEAGIPVQIVPGISSAVAVPAYAGVPVTHRSINSQISIVTGRKSELNSDIVNFDKYPPVSVILMGSKNRKEIVRSLIRSEQYFGSTPAMVILNGTLAEQEVFTTTIDYLEQIKIETTPALIVVGDVVNLRGKKTWFDVLRNQFLGKKLIIPTSSNVDKSTEIWLKNLGLEVKYLSFLDFEMKEFTISDLDEYDVIVFTSKRGVEIVCEKYRLPKDKQYFSIGPTTQKKLKQHGVSSVYPNKFTSVALGEMLREKLKPSTKILLLRSENASPDLRTILEKSFIVKEKSIYEVLPRKISADDLNGADFIFITAGTVAKAIKPISTFIINKQIKLISIGPTTSRTMTELEMNPCLEAQTHTIKGLGYSLIDYFSKLELRKLQQQP